MILRDCKPSKTNSFFLFGPRGVGKTTLLEGYFAPSESLYVDLLDLQTYDDYMMDIRRFEAHIDSPDNKNKRVIVDEIQRMPRLLDVVHSQIQKRKRHFVLTGSSSRRLKQRGANLLAGRAWEYRLYPFSSHELKNEFDLKRAVEVGTLPDAYLADNTSSAHEYLSAYVVTYLEKEIQQEQWVRNLPPFRKFLAIAAQMNGKILNRSRIASEAGVNDVTISNYLQILEDTYLGFLLPAFHTSARKAQRLSPKFYFTDPGVKRAVERTLSVPLLPQTSAWGAAFEHWIVLEFVKNISYQRLDWSLSYLRTKDDVEIDLIVERPGMSRLMIEIKSAEKVFESDAKPLETLGVDTDKRASRWIFSNDPLRQEFGSTTAIHWREGLKEIFG